jgi:hypothetical protein
MKPHLEQLVTLQMRVVQFLVFFQLLLQLLVLDGEIINDAPETIGAAAIVARLP